jgi:hypothetical protein
MARILRLASLVAAPVAPIIGCARHTPERPAASPPPAPAAVASRASVAREPCPFNPSPEELRNARHVPLSSEQREMLQRSYASPPIQALLRAVRAYRHNGTLGRDERFAFDVIPADRFGDDVAVLSSTAAAMGGADLLLFFKGHPHTAWYAWVYGHAGNHDLRRPWHLRGLAPLDCPPEVVRYLHTLFDPLLYTS